ncbi:MAG: SDR family oxidoreductase [Boseongicola sp.]|nr:SDR family oxidoreductase [Boseongicola sp.]NNL17118.1 SDR family oxidoreductase [Boseongicola sp.]
MTPLDQTALIVTGAARGIGKAIAQHAVKNGLRQILLTDIDEADLSAVARSMPDDLNIKTYAADLTEPEAPTAICNFAKSCFGRVDGLVNSAGITDRASLTDGTPDQWERLFAINARAPFLMMQEVVKDMLARKQPGSIVNIQSVNAHCGGPELAIYAASKGALQTLTKNAANAHLADRIRVNGINLGWTLTESEHQMQTKTLGEGEDWAERVGASRPLGRLLMPDEAARLALYLLSPDSEPLTGASIDLEQSVLGAPS